VELVEWLCKEGAHGGNHGFTRDENLIRVMPAKGVCFEYSRSD
jgi:hypothetical protein